MNSTKQDVTILLEQYEEYKILQKQETELSHAVAKAKLLNGLNDELIAQHRAVKHSLEELSNAMTFSNPIVWMLYKFEAYKEEAQPIQTMHDFRVHCSKPGYICTKRFEFLNNALKKRGLTTLADKSAFMDELLLTEVSNKNWLESLCAEDSFIQEWNKHEYYTVNGRAAKWENYLPEEIN